MAFLLSGTKVAQSNSRVKLNIRVGMRHRDIGDEDYLPVDNDTESRLERQKIMKFVTRKIRLSTQGNSEISNLTDKVKKYLKGTNFNSGFVNLFIPGATGGLTTMEYEPGLIDDIQKTFQRIAPDEIEYLHNVTHKDGNAHSHICASLIGPFLSIPFKNTDLQLGKWQQIVFIDFDNRSRKREIILQIIGG